MMKWLVVPVLILSVLSLNGQILPLLQQLPAGDFNPGLQSGSYEVAASDVAGANTADYLYWYPTDDKQATLWTYERYVTLFTEDSDNAIRAFKAVPVRFGASDAMLDQILKGETKAVYGASLSRPSAGLIVYISSKGATPYTDALQCETLASYGFEVLAIRLDDNDLSPQVEAELIDKVVTLFISGRNYSYDAIGVLGHGYGGTIALLYALEDRVLPIRAYAGLDPSFVGNSGLDEIKYLDLPSMSEFKPALFLPVSGFWQKTGERLSDFNNIIFESAPSENADMIFMEKLLHHSFVSDMHLRLDNSGVDFEEHGVEQNRALIDQSYRLLSEMLVGFFARGFGQSTSDFSAKLSQMAATNSELMYLLDDER